MYERHARSSSQVDSEVEPAMIGRLEDRVIVITGAETGIGRAVARRCASEGARVAVAGVNESMVDATTAELRDTGAKCIGLVMDVRDESSIEEGIDRVVAEFGRLDALHANAGVGQRNSRLVDLGVDEWEAVFAVNSTGVFLALRAAARRLMEQGDGGTLLVTGSSTVLRPGIGALAYAAAKAGVHMMVKTLALELAPYKINVNGIAPGLTATPLTTAVEGQIEKGLGIVPLGRPIQPEEIGGLAAFLLSREAEAMTGTIVSMDGGRTAD